MRDRKIKKAAFCLAMSFVLTATGCAAAGPESEPAQNEQQAVVQESTGQETALQESDG